jgi:hypothetical protein
MGWERARYGDGESISLADGRCRVVVCSPIGIKGEPTRYYGTVDLHATSTNKEQKEEARHAILQVARRRLAQALAEVEALIREAK